MWPQKYGGGPYNCADSVHWPFIYIHIKELHIYKKESGCIHVHIAPRKSRPHPHPSQYDVRLGVCGD